MFADCLDAYPTDPLVVLQAVDFYDAIDQQERATALLRRTFEETRAPHFGYALSRRVRRLGYEEGKGRSMEHEAGERPSENAGFSIGGVYVRRDDVDDVLACEQRAAHFARFCDA